MASSLMLSLSSILGINVVRGETDSCELTSDLYTYAVVACALTIINKMKTGMLPKITSALLYVFWNNLKNGDDNIYTCAARNS